MWKDTVEKRYFWATMEKELEKLLYELVKAEEEEDAGIYLLIMHYGHAHEEIPFTAKEKEKTLRLLEILIADSRKHQRLLRESIGRLKAERDLK